MKCLVIDDEMSARSRLKRLLKSFADVEVVGEADDGVQGLVQIETFKPDLIFLDIQMPCLNGFEMLRALPSDIPLPLVVFVTSHDDYALAAFDAQAIAYLLKPVESEQLPSILVRVRHLIQKPLVAKDQLIRLSAVVEKATKHLDQIVAKRLGRFFLLRASEIFYFAADSGTVWAHTKSEVFQVDLSLNDLEERLTARRFFRAHRASLVNLSHVREIDPSFRSSYVLLLADNAKSEIRVSERQAKLLREQISGL